MDAQQAQPAQTTPDHKVVVTLPEELLTNLRTTCAEKAKVALLGRIQGKHPGQKALTAWARENLHSSLILLSVQANNLFEVTFSQPEGRLHALTQTEIVCETATIFFSSWNPHFDSKTPLEQDQLDFAIWLQIANLSQVLREEATLRAIGEHIGQVVAIDNSEAYRAKLFGPRIRILVRDLDNLPCTAVLPRLDGTGVVEYNLEYIGLPNQCGRCRSREHQVRHCPRRDLKYHRRETHNRNKPANPLAAPLETAATTAALESIEPRIEEAWVDSPQVQPQTNTQDTTDNKEAETREEAVASPNTTTQVTQEKEKEVIPELVPNDTNFPQLNSPKPATPTPPSPTSQPPGTPHTFVWRRKPDVQPPDPDKGKGKAPSTDSTPLTRQGYRSGHLAEDF